MSLEVYLRRNLRALFSIPIARTRDIPYAPSARFADRGVVCLVYRRDVQAVQRHLATTALLGPAGEAVRALPLFPA